MPTPFETFDRDPCRAEILAWNMLVSYFYNKLSHLQNRQREKEGRGQVGFYEAELHTLNVWNAVLEKAPTAAIELGARLMKQPDYLNILAASKAQKAKRASKT